MSKIRNMSTEKLKEFKEQIPYMFWDVLPMKDFKSSDFQVGSIVWEILDEYEKRQQNDTNTN